MRRSYTFADVARMRSILVRSASPTALIGLVLGLVLATAGRAQDTTPPELLDLQILTPVVDVTSGPADAVILVDSEDDLSGADLPTFTLEFPTGTSQSPGFGCVVVSEVLFLRSAFE